MITMVHARRNLLWTLRSVHGYCSQHRRHLLSHCNRPTAVRSCQIGFLKIHTVYFSSGEENAWYQSLQGPKHFVNQVSHPCLSNPVVSYRPLTACKRFSNLFGAAGSEAGPSSLQFLSTVWVKKGQQFVRHKSGGKKSQGSSSESSDEESDFEELDDDDYEAPPNFKKVQIYLKSLRADSVVSSALNISRNCVDEIFFGSRLRLNGEKLLKKSKQMKEGDYVDVIMERLNDDDQLLVKRVKVIDVSSERTNKDKIVVIVKAWKNAFPIEDTSNAEWK